MRLGIFGGSFDPVHYGHLLLAECAREQARLDQLWFVPANQQPLKRRRSLTPGPLRVQMLELAIGGHEAFAVSTVEVDRGGVSYTFETLAAIHAAQPQDELFFLLGADAIGDLPRWREPRRICEMATLLVACRAGAAEPDMHAAADPLGLIPGQTLRYQRIDMPQVELSSREIRRRVSQGQSIRYRVPRGVEKLIEAKRLYRGESEI